MAFEGEREIVEVVPANPVLVAEIPGGDRWKQANFDQHTFETFFEAKLGTRRWVCFQHVNAAGIEVLEPLRPSIIVPSVNFRFELGAGAGLPYPMRTT